MKSRVVAEKVSPVLIVESRYYEDLADGLAKGAGQVLERAKVPYERLAVPGVFEVPAAIRLAIRSMEVHAASSSYAGFVALGCVIRGETDHYEHICREASRALMDIAVNHGVALGFGILTCDTHEQARERADPDRQNKGGDAAAACLRMMEIKKILHLVQR
jgi:6,7-dimethyl-8-ribityllumazine synthase